MFFEIYLWINYKHFSSRKLNSSKRSDTKLYDNTIELVETAQDENHMNYIKKEGKTEHKNKTK